MDTVRIGFIGCGSHATNNLYPMLAYARATLVAVCDLDEQLARRNARIYGAGAFYTSIERMLANEQLDGVMIVGPAELHYQAGMQALRRGLPVFVEKPTAPDLARTEEMVRTAAAHGTFIMTGFMKRHGLPYRRIHDLIDGGRFVPNACLMKYMHWPMGVADLRSMLLSMSSHPIDLLLSYFGMPRRLQCALGQGTNGWATLGINLSWSDGKVGQLALGSQARIQERLEMSGALDGQPAFAVVDNVMHLEIHRQGSSGIDLFTPSLDQIAPTCNEGDIHIWRPDYAIPNMGQTRHFVQGFVGEVREFCEAIIAGRAPNPQGEDAIQVMRVIEAIVARPDGTSDL